MFASAKRKQQKQFRQLQCQEQCIDHNYPILPFGIVACTLNFCLTTYLEIAVYLYNFLDDLFVFLYSPLKLISTLKTWLPEQEMVREKISSRSMKSQGISL